MTDTNIENLPFVLDFKKTLRRKDYANSTEIAIKTAELFKEIIKSLWGPFPDLINVLQELGKSFINVDPLQFSVGNIIKRVFLF
jgi:translation initiation factor 2B subunit (eIF-2B alpha/beta/delta family)